MPDPLTSRALYDLVFVSDPHVAPDGRTVAAVHTRIEDGTPPRYASRVHLADARTGADRAFTQGGGKDTHPRFAPDGAHLAFLSDRAGGKPQVHVVPLAGGEARAVTAFAAGVSEFAWLPDGRGLAVVARAEAEPDLGGLARRITRPYYRADGAGYLPEAPTQLWTVGVDGGAPVQRTDLHASVSQVSAAADGTLVFVAARDRDAEGYYFRQVWRLAPGGTAPTPVVAQDDPLIAAWPTVSPGGRQVAYLAPCDPAAISSPTGVWVVPATGGTPRLLTGDVDAVPLVGGDARYGRGPHAPTWLDDGTLLVYVGERGSAGVAVVDVATGARRALHREGEVVTGFAYAGGTLAVVRERADRPGELFAARVGADGLEGEVRASRANDAWVERFAPVAISPLREVASDDGADRLGYWTLAPRAPRADGALVLQVHGGPRTTYGHGFSFEMQLLAARGYTVVFGNPRGGAGFGRAFADAISGRLGTIDADDVRTIARDARARHALPGAPMHLTGGSYGGFMTNWLVGVTDEFASAVTQRSISNWSSMWGTSDVGFSWMSIEVGDVPWGDPQRLWDQSPMKHADRVTTPLLIVHAEQDHRCPIEQAEQWFVALRTLGRAPVEFLRFPDEGHDLSRSGRPDRRIQRLDAIVDWFERHPTRG